MKHFFIITTLLTTTAYGALRHDAPFADVCGITHVVRPISPIKKILPRLSPTAIADEKRPDSPALVNFHGFLPKPRVPSMLASILHPIEPTRGSSFPAAEPDSSEEDEEIHFPTAGARIFDDRSNEVSLTPEENALRLLAVEKTATPEALYNYADMLSKKGFSLAHQEARRYYRLAAKQDHIDAGYQYARILFEGRYVKQNIKKATRYFDRATVLESREDGIPE